VTDVARARNWRDVRADALEAGRITEQGIAESRRLHEEQARAYLLRQVRESRLARQEDVAEAMHVSQSRVSRIESGDITHAEMGTLSAYVRALGGVLRVTADFGDQMLTLGTEAPAPAVQAARTSRRVTAR
jgi:predicted XRE-type DNA-binding protein